MPGTTAAGRARSAPIAFGSTRTLVSLLVCLVSLNVGLRLARHGLLPGRHVSVHGIQKLGVQEERDLPPPVVTLLKELSAGGTFTLFAPSRDAYSRWLSAQQVAGRQAQSSADALAGLLANHVLEELVFAEDVPSSGLTVKAISGRTLRLSRPPDGGGLLVNGVPAERCDLGSAQGVVHIIAGVIDQQAAADSGGGVPSGMLCSGRGTPHGTQGCSCAALYSGPGCGVAAEVAAWRAGRSRYTGPIVLAADNLARLDALVAETPGKQLRILDAVSPQLRGQLTAMLPPSDVVTGAQYRSCALVGSSGILLRRRAGKEIDAHDMVLRFNSAPTAAYSEHVGGRTTYRVCNGEHMNIREGNETVIHHLKARSFLRKFMLYSRTVGQGAPPLLFHPDFTSYVAGTLSFIPSSGYFAIMMALQTCQRVTLYGFFASDRHGARHHYYNAEAPSNQLRDDSEYRVAKQLAAAGLLSFGDPCVVECQDSQSACQECLGDTPLEELAALERWTEAQVRANAAREAGWEQARRWDWAVEGQWDFSEERGVFRKAVPKPQSGQPDSARAQRPAAKSPRRP
mmetsp:Transcript_46729/g.118280  ORF Transcript_46729/g.118280 Transcript_46729/m.118280 type:complete len:570 (-) Transcript_46729:491-2200(-)